MNGLSIMSLTGSSNPIRTKAESFQANKKRRTHSRPHCCLRGIVMNDFSFKVAKLLSLEKANDTCSLVWIKSTQNNQNTSGLLLWRRIRKMGLYYSCRKIFVSMSVHLNKMKLRKSCITSNQYGFFKSQC